MIFLYLLCLVMLCNGSQLEESPKNVELFTFRNVKESGFVVNWTKVENNDEADPVLGYKVFVWEEKVSYGYELKEDGTLEPKAFETIPSGAMNSSLNVLFELLPNGTFVTMKMEEMLLKVWQNRIKFVYKLKLDGLLETLTVEDIPTLELRHDSSTKVTEIDVPADKTEAVYKGTKRSFIYEIAVQAYTSTSTGPLSNKIKIITF